MKSIPELTESELIDAVLAGSESAFQSLLDRFQERVFRLLSRMSRDHGEVEDLAQEVFVKVFRKLHTFQQGSSLYTWIYRIAINTANDHLTRRKRRRLYLVEEEAELDAGADTGHDGSVQPLIDSELREITRRILSGLPEKYRTILILREYEDLSYTEMAEVLQCSIGTVESRLFRARQRFKEALARLHPEHLPSAVDARGVER